MKGNKNTIVSLIFFVFTIVFITACGNSPEPVAPADGGTGRFTIWVPSASNLPVSPSPKGLTDLIESGNVFDTGNPSFDLNYAEAVMQCMPLFSRLEKVNVASSSTSLDDLKGSLGYSLYGYSFVPDMTKTKLNDDGLYVFSKAYEGAAADDKDPVGFVEYYYNFRKNRLTYRQYVMLTIEVMQENGIQIMNNGVLVYCLDDVAVGADGTLAVNQITADGTLEKKEAYTDYLWLGDNMNLSWYDSKVHGDISDFIETNCYKAGFERRVMTFMNKNGITAAFLQPWSSFMSTRIHWEDIGKDDSIKVLMHSMAHDYRITESNKDAFNGDAAIAFARLMYSNGDSIAKGGWTKYEDFADASLQDLRTDAHGWLSAEDTGNRTFWMSYFDSDDATTGDKTKRAYYNSQIISHQDVAQRYIIGTKAYQDYGFSNLFGPYSASDTGNEAVTKTILSSFLPFCLKASETQIAALVDGIMTYDEGYEPGHVHTFSETWEHDENLHWHPATCHPEEKADVGGHVLESENWIVSKQATMEEAGEEYNFCTVCGYKATRITRVELWSISDAGAVVPLDKSSIKGKVVVPGEVHGVTVRKIGYGAFIDCTGLTGVEIPDTVTVIEDYAFANCSSLTSIDLPDSVTDIGSNAFKNCGSLTSISIPASVTSIGASAFSSCGNLSSIMIPDSVTAIGSNAFKSCSSLTNITIPKTVKVIGSSAFQWCTGLTGITIPDSVTTIGYGAFYGCSNLKSITIPDSVSSIGDYAFYDCRNLASITIPDSVTSIGNHVFENCWKLASIDLGDSVTSIGDYAFEECKVLTSITIPNSVASIGNHAFDLCVWLKDVNIPGSVKSIGDYAFRGCSLTSITIPDSVTSVGEHAFYNSGLTSLEVSDSITSMGDSAFVCLSLKQITLNADSMSSYLNMNCEGLPISSVDTFELQIDGEPASGDIVIPSGIKAIPRFAFYKMSDITGITIPDSVTSIEDSAFQWCDGLKRIDISHSSDASMGDRVFFGCSPEEITVHVDDLSSYLGLDFGDRSELKTFKLYVGGNMVSGDVSIPSGITALADKAFYGCSGITGITIPDSVTTIGGYAFYGCSDLKSITIPASVKWIGPDSIGECTSLTDITFTGTTSEWDSIGTNGDWKGNNVPATEVKCSDGVMGL